MRNEMDLLQFDERQRLAWLLAQNRVPLFMIAMVPVFALSRVGLFSYYCSTTGEPGGPPRGSKLGDHLKTTGTLLLMLALFLPLYGFAGTGNGSETDYRYAWDLVLHYDWTLVFPLVFAFFWPLPIRFVSRRAPTRRLAIVAQWAEPLLAAMSILTILFIPQILWEARQLFWFVFMFDSARPQAGSFVAVAANGLYLVGWLASALRPWVLQPRDAV